MRLEHTFDVPAPPERAWHLLMDVPRVIACVPGAVLNETIGEAGWRATISVKLGPTSFLFASDVRRVEADRETWRATLDIVARELRGRGSGQATVRSSLEPAGGGTRVTLVTDLTVVGAVAQHGRDLLQPLSAHLIESLADCLRESIEQAASA